MRLSRCSVVLSLTMLLAPAFLTAQERADRLPIDDKEIAASLGTDWYGLYLSGKKIGFFTSTRERLGTEPGAPVRDAFELSMKIASFGQKAEMNLKEARTFEGKPPYRLMEGTSLMRDGRITQEVSLKRQREEFEVLTTVAKETRRKRIPAADYTLADSLLSDVWARRGPKVGDKVTYREFDVKDLKLEISKSKVLAIKNSLVGGVPVKYFEIETQTSDGVKVVSLHDTAGKLLSGKFAIFELRAEPEEQAKNTEYSQDLFVMGLAKVDRPLGDLQNVTGLVLEVKGREAEVLRSGPRQAVSRRQPDTFTIKLGKAHGEETRPTKQELEDALAETDDYPIHHPKIKALATKAVGDAKTPEEKVRRLVRFVHGHVKPALSATIPNIFDLLERKKGDCKSYALLFTVLARSAGVPAREVTGLMYVGDDQKAFGGHAWNEVVLDGRWVPVDASLGETDINATHLSFGARATNSVLTTLGKLSFRVVEVERSK